MSSQFLKISRSCLNKSILFCCTFVCISLVWPASAQVTVLYNPVSSAVGPFPSNALTVPDSTQKTGLRVSLTADFSSCDPGSSPSVCGSTSLLNQLDGFSVNPRMMVCFSGAVDTATLKSGITIIPLSAGVSIGINQIFYDQNSNCAFAKPNQVLNQQSQYVLLVSDSVQAGGAPVAADLNFKNCLQSTAGDYCTALGAAVQQATGGNSSHVVAASLFTTMTATGWLEQARQYVDAHQPAVWLPAGVPSSFNLSGIRDMTWIPQGNSSVPPQPIPLSVLSGVGKVAFGLYLSPNFLNPSNGTIAAASTNAPIGGPVPTLTAPLGYAAVSYHAFLPSSPAPPSGYPVVIYGHGMGDDQFGAPTFIASKLAQNGFATLAIEITGHGYGPLSTVRVTDNLGLPHVLLTPGRGIVIPGNTQIGATDGCIVPGPLAVRDCARQTAVDLFALVRTIQQTNGLGLNLDPKRIYYVGQSFGSNYGTLVQAVEPGITAAVLNGDGGTLVDVARLSITGRPIAIAYLASVNPALLNLGTDFNDNYVFRDQPPVVNAVDGAPAIQAAFEAADWLGMPGDPLAYAPHLKTSLLAGVPAKSTLIQYGYGDLEMPNPTESALIRAAGLQDSSWFLHFETAVGLDPSLLGITGGLPFPILPHRVLSNQTIFDYPAETSLALAEQQQAAAFFASNGASNPDPNQYLAGEFAGVNLFEILKTLPESLNFLIPVGP